MATIRITSPQAKGHAKITVKGRPKLVFVNGHWNRVMHFLGMGPVRIANGIGNIFVETMRDLGTI
jgi:hypothetical protein